MSQEKKQEAPKDERSKRLKELKRDFEFATLDREITSSEFESLRDKYEKAKD